MPKKRKGKVRKPGDEPMFVIAVLFVFAFVLGGYLLFSETSVVTDIEEPVPTQSKTSSIEVKGMGDQAQSGVGPTLQGGTGSGVQQSGDVDQTLQDPSGSPTQLQPGAGKDVFQQVENN